MVQTVKALYSSEVSKTLRERVVRACKEAVMSEDWFQAAKFTRALFLDEFDEEVCTGCDRFCYVTSCDYAMCPKTEEAIELMNETGLAPEEVDFDLLR